MIRFIITTVLFLVILLLSYNYFFGTAEEKKQAREIFNKGAEVVGAGADLLKSEYQKYRDGKYDEALDNVGHLLNNLNEQSSELFEEIDNWNLRKNEWEQKKNDFQQLLDTHPDSIDERTVNNTVAELEEERKALEIEGQRLKARAE